MWVCGNWGEAIGRETILAPGRSGLWRAQRTAAVYLELLADFVTTKNGQNRNPRGRPVKNTPEQVAEALLKADGNLTTAAATGLVAVTWSIAAIVMACIYWARRRWIPGASEARQRGKENGGAP